MRNNFLTTNNTNKGVIQLKICLEFWKQPLGSYFKSHICVFLSITCLLASQFREEWRWGQHWKIVPHYWIWIKSHLPKGFQTSNFDPNHDDFGIQQQIILRYECLKILWGGAHSLSWQRKNFYLSFYILKPSNYNNYSKSMHFFNNIFQ